MPSTWLVRSISVGSRRKALRQMGSTVYGSRERTSVKQKTHLEEDDENNEDADQVGTSVSPVSSDSPQITHVRRSKELTAVTRKGQYTREELSLSDDVLSSMTRSFENRPVDTDEQQLGVVRTLLDWSIDPDNVLAFYWKAAVSVAVMYNCTVIILRMAFTEMRSEDVFTVLDMVCDIMYVLDIVVESKTSFLSDGCLVKDTKQTFQHYKGKQQFIRDLVSVLPIHALVGQVTHISNQFQLAQSEMVQFRKYYEDYHSVLRLNRLLKCHAMDRFFQQTESRTNNPNLLRAFKLSLHLGLVIHWIACLYYMMSEFEGLGTNGWVYPLETNVTRFSRKYILCMFWSTMILTTIGERPPPVTELEYVFTGFTFLVGVFVFAAVVGNVGDVISNMNAGRRDFQARMDQIKFYMNHRNVPDQLQNRIKRWAEYTWDRTRAVDEPNVMQFLPDRLRAEVAIHVHLSILKKVSIFDECEEGLLRELVLKLRPQIFSPGDYICRIGEIGREMYIINHGKVEILFPDFETGDMIQVAVMHPGNFFGEISLLKLDDGQNKRTADVRSTGFSELLCLSRRDLMMALTEYPEAKKILEEYARKRFNHTKKLTPPDTEDSGNVSPRVSFVSTHSKRTARHVFSQVMKQEGFAKLLATTTRNSELAEIRAALEELRVTQNAMVEDKVLCLQKQVQELEQLVLDKNVELQEARAQVSFLEKVIEKPSQRDMKTRLTELSSLTSGSSDVAADVQWNDLDLEITAPPTTQNKERALADNSVVKGYNVPTQPMEVVSEYLNHILNSVSDARRHSFRTTVSKNISSTEVPSSSCCRNSSVDPMASCQYENGYYDDINITDKLNTVSVGSASPPYSLLTCRSQRRATAPYTSFDVCRKVKAYRHHADATIYDPQFLSLHPSRSCISAPRVGRNPCELGNSFKVTRCRASTNIRHGNKKVFPAFRNKNYSNPTCTLRNKQLYVGLVDSSRTSDILTGSRCSLRHLRNNYVRMPRLNSAKASSHIHRLTDRTF